MFSSSFFLEMKELISVIETKAMLGHQGHKNENFTEVNSYNGFKFNLDRTKMFNPLMFLYDNEITSLIDIYCLRISFIPSDPLRYFIYVTYFTDK